MAAPIVGPITQVVSTGDYYMVRDRYRQARPYQPLAYHMRRATAHVRNPGSTAISTVATPDHIATYTDDWNPLLSRVYDSLKGKLSARASMGVTLTEFGQSYDMITKRCVELTRFVRNLSRGDLVGAAQTLKVSVVPKGASKHKAFANNFLEYAFGWAPLVSDIGNAVEVLQEPIKNVYAKAARSETFPRYNMAVPYSGAIPNAVWPRLLTWESYDFVTGVRTVKMGAEIRITNSNLWLANQLGFTNPAVFVYEKIPFSFVLNWFANVEQFLALSSDWHGAALENAWTLYHCGLKREAYASSTYRWWEGNGYVYGGGITRREIFSIVQQKRSIGLDRPSLFVRPAYAPGLQRALTAVSLLIQQFSRR